MAISGLQVIDIGLQNESTGSDSLYTAFNKTKNNFAVIANTATPFPTFTGNAGINVVANSNTATVGITNTGVLSIIAGTNITVNSANGNVTINSSGGSGSGTVTSVGITPVSSSRLTVTNSPVTTTGNISIDLANSGVTSGNYTLPNITVDIYGRITNISNGIIIGSQLTNGNSNVIVGANSNVTISVNGTANVLVLSNTTSTLNGNLVVGNLSGTLLTGTLSTAAQPNITSLGSLTSLIVTGNINGANITGNHYGAATGLTSIPGANVTGAVTYATTANSVAGANVTGAVANSTYANSSGTAGTVTTVAQPNITSVGTLSSLIVSGNINTGNVSGANAISANYFIGSGNNLSNIQAANITGRVANATYANTSGSATSAGSAGTATYAATSGSAGSAITATTAQTVTLGAQGNITSVGTLSSLIVSGNVNAGNVVVNGIFKLGRLTSAQIANLSATNGDMVYNSTLNKFQGYENGAWANLI